LDFSYHSYFDPDLVFEDDRPLGRERRNSHQKFCETGFSDSEARDLVASGYDVLLDEIVIDRYYGGALMRCDFRTRFPLRQFRSTFGSQSNGLQVHSVTSSAELFKLIEKLQAEVGHRLLFRGQTGHYSINRAVPNPTFVNTKLGETSLLPSVWRRVLTQRQNVWHQFRDLSMFEWSTIIYHLYDLQVLREQETAAGFPYGISDPDEIPEGERLQSINGFHAHRQAFLNEYGFGSSAGFLTLLQHYGLYSPVLDLTTDPEVALFFATHKFARLRPTCSYGFNGTNQRQAIIYVLYEDSTETLQYVRTKMLERLDPQRPKRQSCVVMSTNEYSMNLAGDYLVAAITLDYDMVMPGRLSAADLFPSAENDPMLAALKAHTHDSIRADLTDFEPSE
jgi:hypothetical protein